MSHFFVSSLLSLDNPNRRNTTKIMLIASYIIIGLEIIQGILFVPLYIKYFGDRLYGLWLATGGVVGLLAFFDLGIPSLMIQRISREYANRNFKGISNYFSSGLILHTLLMILLLSFALALIPFLDDFVKINPNELPLLKKAFLIAIFATILSLLNNGIEGVANALQKPLIVKSSMVIGSFFGIIIIYICLIEGWSIMAIPIGLLVRSGISFLINQIYLVFIFRFNNISFFNINHAVTKDYLSLTPFAFFSKLGTSIANSIEPTLIARFITPEIAVYYSVTSKIGILLKSILERINGSLFPSFAHYFGEKSLSETKNMFLYILHRLLIVGLILFSYYLLYNEAFISLWVGTDKYLGDKITLFIGIALFVAFISSFLSYLLGSVGDIKTPSILLSLESLLKIGLLFIFIQQIGVVGIPVAIIISSITFIFIYLFRWKKMLNIKILRTSIACNKFIFFPFLYLLIIFVLNQMKDYLKINFFFTISVFVTLPLSITLFLTLFPGYKDTLIRKFKI